MSALALLVGAGSPARGQSASSLSSQDVLLAARALHFLVPSPTGNVVVAVVYSLDNAASKEDADRIAALVRSAPAASGVTLQAMSIASSSLPASPAVFSAIIGALGASPETLMSAARARHVVCITGEVSLVEAGRCVLSISSSPRVEIAVSQSAAEACGIMFAAAFRLMARQV